MRKAVPRISSGASGLFAAVLDLSNIFRPLRPCLEGPGQVCFIGGPLGAGALDSEGSMDTQDHLSSTPENPGAHLAMLLLETGQGNHAAFTEFYERTSQLVFGVVRRVVVDAGLSEEVTQEVFIIVWQDASKYDPALGSPTGWLVTIAHRRAVDKVRTHQRSTDRDARWAASSWVRPFDEVAASFSDRMEALQLVDSLRALSPLQREPIVLAYFGALTYREVAERLSAPLPTIKSRVRAGLQQLRGQLDPV